MPSLGPGSPQQKEYIRCFLGLLLSACLLQAPLAHPSWHLDSAAVPATDSVTSHGPPSAKGSLPWSQASAERQLVISESVESALWTHLHQCRTQYLPQEARKEGKFNLSRHPALTSCSSYLLSWPLRGSKSSWAQTKRKGSRCCFRRHFSSVQW